MTPKKDAKIAELQGEIFKLKSELFKTIAQKKTDQEKLKEAILKILNHYNTNMESYYSRGNNGVPETYFDDVTTEILDIFRGEK
ncbi:MAG: hypothetical protein ACKOW2_08710 [Sphingobacteriaceae bacterium]